MSSLKPNYLFYATLLDAFQWYMDSEQDNAFQEFIDKINRVPFSSEAAEKGKAFNEIVDVDINLLPKEDIKHYDSFKFKQPLIDHFKAYFKGAASQVYISSNLETNKGVVELYGYADKVLQDTCFDIKCTGQYLFPKFIGNWQHKVYPYCFSKNGIFVNRFEYTVTDYNNFWKEQYVFNPEKDIPALQNICESLIDFIEKHRALITDKKIFNLKQ